MADRSIVVALRANVTDFRQQIGAAADQLGDLAKRAGGAEKVSNTFLGRLAQATQVQRDSWDAVSSGLSRTGVAMAGLSGLVLKTGISYNTLQQTSRAALTTMLGSAQAANAQMDKLDAFARSSPFAKQVFIQAQQQMLAFGIETKKVIPYLDSIQDAVAAAGGSNQDIAELTRIFSQVRAASKITAVDLMQFGQRGVDAASLIGSQMGKTGSQIRSEITKGTLDADKALDALAAGMKEKFGGAADNVKNTFAGALDRVKAAWRDMSSAIAEPLVGRESGGLLVEGMNKLADFMRVIERAPGPLKELVFWSSTAVGGLALLTGGAMKGISTFVDYRKHVSALASTFPRLATAARITGIAFGSILGVAALAAGGLAMYASAQARAKARAEEFAATLDENTGALTRQSAELIHADYTAKKTWATLAGVAQQTSLQEFAERNAIAFQDLIDAVAGTDAEYARFVQRIRAMDNGDNTDEIKKMVEVLDSMRDRVTSGRAALSELKSTQEAIANSSSNAAARIDTLTESIAQQAGALDNLYDALQRTYGITKDRLSAEYDFEAAVRAANGAVQENGATLDSHTEKGKRNFDALLGISDAAWSTAESMHAYGDSADLIVGRMGEMRERFVQVATAMTGSKAEAEALADKLGLIPEDIAIKVEATTEQANEALSALVLEIATTNESVNIDGEDISARSTLSELMAAVGMSEDSVKILGDVDPGKTTLAEYMRLIKRSEGAVKIKGNNKAGLDAVADVKASAAKGATVPIGVSGLSSARSSIVNTLGGAVSVRVRAMTMSDRAHGGPVFGYNSGGAVRGPGTGTSDSIVAYGPSGHPNYRLSNGEHIWTTQETLAIGGHAAMYRLRRLALEGALRPVLGYAAGGGIGARVERFAPPRRFEQARQQVVYTQTVHQHISHAMVEPDSTYASNDAARARLLMGVL